MSTEPLASVRGVDEADWHAEGAVLGQLDVTGTYLHGILDNQGFRELWLERVRNGAERGAARSTLSPGANRERQYDRLAAAVRGHLRLNVVYQAMGLEGAEDHTRGGGS